MRISFSPQARSDQLTLVRSGDTLVLNGEAFDFSSIPEGGELPPEAIASDWFASGVARIEGELQFTLILPHGPDAPEETRFPGAIAVAGDGPVALPPYETPVVEECEEGEPGE